jgi:hypothetical protein
VIPGAVHRSPRIYLTAEENFIKPQTVGGVYATSRRLKWGPLPLSEFGSMAQQVRKGENKGRTGYEQ